MTKPRDLIGSRSGHLLVVSRAKNDAKNGTQWNCKCDCGKQVVVRGQYLVGSKRGYQQKTCSRQCKYFLEVFRLDLTGRKFNRLIALRCVGTNRNGEALWEFRCLCDNTIVRSGVEVRRGHVTNCGCQYGSFKHGKSDTAEYRTERTRKWRENHPERAHALSRRSIANRGLCTPKWLTPEQIKEMGEFYRTANRLTKETGIEHQVDHIYPLQGKLSCGLHVPWNLRVITAEENRLKSNSDPKPEDIVRTEWQHSEVPDKEQVR